MKRFATLFATIDQTTKTSVKTEALAQFFREAPETDRLWAALTSDGGSESRCAWCVDRFGISWQIVPKDLPRYVGGLDPEGARRATEAMMGMSKIDIAALRAAYEG